MNCWMHIYNGMRRGRNSKCEKRYREYKIQRIQDTENTKYRQYNIQRLQDTRVILIITPIVSDTPQPYRAPIAVLTQEP